MGCCPVGETGAELVDQERIGVGAFDEIAYGVGGADQSVRRAGSGTGQQARPPGGQQLVPVLVIELASEVRIPVTDAVDPAEVDSPVLGGHRVPGFRGRIELGAVVLDPALDLIAAAEADHGVGCHRAMVGEEPAELGARSPKAVEGSEHHLGAMVCNWRAHTSLRWSRQAATMTAATA